MPAPIASPLPADDQKVAAEALQGALVDLIDLSLIAKQAHWNVVGRNFRSLHLQLDEVVVMARLHLDEVAERATAIGVNPDGSAATVAASSQVPSVPPAWIDDVDVVQHFVDALTDIVGRFRERIASTESPDPVTQDLLIGITADLEKSAWMFQAERARQS
jgi:starvation-inducible DNA-binding protein